MSIWRGEDVEQRFQHTRGVQTHQGGDLDKSGSELESWKPILGIRMSDKKTTLHNVWRLLKILRQNCRNGRWWKQASIGDPDKGWTQDDYDQYVKIWNTGLNISAWTGNYKQIITLYTCQSCSIYKIRLKKLEV